MIKRDSNGRIMRDSKGLIIQEDRGDLTCHESPEELYVRQREESLRCMRKREREIMRERDINSRLIKVEQEKNKSDTATKEEDRYILCSKSRAYEDASRALLDACIFAENEVRARSETTKVLDAYEAVSLRLSEALMAYVQLDTCKTNLGEAARGSFYDR